MGFGPQLVDLDHDGRIDLLSGSWPGELFLFRGGPDRTFGAPEMMKDANGVVMNLFGGWTEAEDGARSLTGNGEFFEEGEKRFVRYHGEVFETTAERPITITGSATAVNAFDWDGDGDEDLLVGEIDGRVVLVPNEGTARKPAFGARRDVMVGAKLLRVDGDAGPFVADWDGDGLPDLLVGANDGSVTWYRNTGTRKAPVLATGVELVARAPEGDGFPTVPTRGVRAKVCAADWNGDGKLDLLLGDYARMKVVLPEPTPEEKAVRAKANAELGELWKKEDALYSELMGPKRTKDRERLKAVRAELDRISKRSSELEKLLPRTEEDHGWVWFFART